MVIRLPCGTQTGPASIRQVALIGVSRPMLTFVEIFSSEDDGTLADAVLYVIMFTGRWASITDKILESSPVSELSSRRRRNDERVRRSCT